MDYPKYQINFMPEAYTGYCSTACFMGILNFFWYTQFNMKDTWDVMKIAKLGTYTFGCGLDEIEMAYALYKLGFSIEYFTGYSEKQDIDYIKNPTDFLAKNTKEKYKKYIQDGKWIDGDGKRTFDTINTTIFEKIKKEPNIKKHYQKDIIDVIQKNQAENVLFILCVNWYVLFDKEEIKGESGGHILICKGIKDGKFEIYDSGPYQKPEYIETSKMVSAMTEMGPYVLIKVKNGN